MAQYITYGTVMLHTAAEKQAAAGDKLPQRVLPPGTTISSDEYDAAEVAELVRVGALLTPSQVLPPSDLDAAVAENAALKARLAELEAAMAVLKEAKGQGLIESSLGDAALAQAEAEASALKGKTK